MELKKTIVFLSCMIAGFFAEGRSEGMKEATMIFNTLSL
jgi:hypothetical protein